MSKLFLSRALLSTKIYISLELLYHAIYELIRIYLEYSLHNTFPELQNAYVLARKADKKELTEHEKRLLEKYWVVALRKVRFYHKYIKEFTYVLTNCVIYCQTLQLNLKQIVH